MQNGILRVSLISEYLLTDDTPQIIPVRCFSCGKVVGDKWNHYLELLAQGDTEGYVVLVSLEDEL